MLIDLKGLYRTSVPQIYLNDIQFDNVKPIGTKSANSKTVSYLLSDPNGEPFIVYVLGKACTATDIPVEQLFGIIRAG